MEIINLVQTNKGGHANVLLFEECHTFLSCVDCVHYNVIQSSTAGGNGYVILLINGPKVSLEE